MTDFPQVPDFDDLPLVEGKPQGCAWGVFDKDGKKDHLGCVNYLTLSVVREAYKEARDGVSISLNAPLDAMKLAIGRRAAGHKAINWSDFGAGFNSWDDELEFNTQGSSQWDSLLHFPHQATGECYNGVIPTKEKLQQSTDQYDPNKEIASLDHWHDRGGLVGRGVLLDYRAYAEAKGIKYDVFDSHTITVKDLEAIAAHQSTELRRGDILVVRTGFMEDILKMSAEQQAGAMTREAMIGVEGNLKSVKWFWNHRFAAVACDVSAFEVLPPMKEDGTVGTAMKGELVLHPWFLSMFGLNIGELWSLEALGKHCAETKRYSFLLTSSPLNIGGLVGSPPNALALF